MNRHLRSIGIGLVLGLFIGGAWILARHTLLAPLHTEKIVPQLGTESAMRYEIVTSMSDQERGLSGRASIPPDYGMLFVFDVPRAAGFWMKDMLTSIDIIWLDDQGRIVKIDPSVSPASYPETFYPPLPVRYVLETRAGEAERKAWKVGTVLMLPSVQN